MNYLAHFYLSGDNDDVLFGNFIGDLVKGKDWQQYEEKVQKGILLHRHIDDFIDKHPYAQRSRKRLRSVFGLTSPVVLDIFFDHYLSTHWNEYHNDELNDFTKTIFDRLRPYKSQMESYYPIMVEKMEQESWIESYKSISGTAIVLQRMSKRVKFKNNWELAEDVLIDNYDELQHDFKLFFPEIIESVENNFNIKCV